MTSVPPEEDRCPGVDDASVSVKINGVKIKATGKSALYIITVAAAVYSASLQL